jgi:hypothetical protein
VIESPYAGDVEMNLRYLRAAMRDCLMRGESPYASHGLYTQPGVLNDDDPVERMQGITAGFEWRYRSDATVVYTDLGITDGMAHGIRHANARHHPVVYRSVPGWAPRRTPGERRDWR